MFRQDMAHCEADAKIPKCYFMTLRTTFRPLGKDGTWTPPEAASAGQSAWLFTSSSCSSTGSTAEEMQGPGTRNS